MTISVAMRLGLEGGQAATRGIEDFGRKGGSALRDLRKEASGLSPHLVAVSRGVGAVKDSVDDLASRSGAIGNVASAFGPLGMAGAAAAAGVAIAGMALYRAAEGAVVMGDAIADAAAKAGVSSDTLQELRYAVHQTGGEYEDADTAISDFTKTLGQAESGYSRALKPFKQLGFSQKDLKSFATADDALRAVAQRVSELGKESELQAISEKLGLGPMIPLLREGAGRMAELREQAHNVGYVMDSELVAAAGDAGDKLEDLEGVIKVQLNSALISTAPLLLSVGDGLAAGAKGARRFFDEIADGQPALEAFLAKAPALKSIMDVLAKGALNFTGINMVSKAIDAYGRSGREKSLIDGMRSMMAGGKVSIAGSDWVPPETKRDRTLKDAGADEAASKAAAAEREARKRAEASGRTDAAIAAAEKRKLTALANIATSLEEQSLLQLTQLDVAEAARVKEIQAQTAEGKIDKARAATLIAEEQRAFDAERKLAADEQRKKIADRDLADAKAVAALSADLLGLMSDSARTAEERRTVELRILALKQKEARAVMEAELAERGDMSGADKQARRDALGVVQGEQVKAVERANMGPLAAYRDRLLRTNAEVRESLQELAVDGFETLNDGIVASILNTGKLGDTFSQIGDMIVGALTRIVVQMTIVGPMLEALTKAGSGGGWLGKFASAAAGALGGSFGTGKVSAASALDLGGANLASRLGAARATGGPVYRGDVRPIDEYGIERYARFSGDGYVNDAARTAREITDQTLSAKSAYGPGAGGAGGGPIAVSLSNNSAMPLQATARETSDGMGGRRLDVDLTEHIDSRVAKGNRDLFSGGYDTAFQSTFGARRRLTGG